MVRPVPHDGPVVEELDAEHPEYKFGKVNVTSSRSSRASSAS